ncbi:MAG TPA: DUF3089 domain-containing protein [Porticoccaceae bacterium]|jgi:hypothetical protein|nr:DUF3089 domain-containing protein [Gammaproteobacteria bacterium]HIL61289.1 DUF3089 domain-containing protein [Porticoccaceae bacterium]
MKIVKRISVGLGVIVLALLGLYFSGYGGDLAFRAFLAYSQPASEFDAHTTVAEPEYSDAINWAALPEGNDPADLMPEGVDGAVQGEHPVDVFFIHPTGFMRSNTWTSPMDLNSGTEENTLWMMANQASVFNGCCNVYAPRYREATIVSYFGETKLRDVVLGFAYEDVKRAFTYFIEHYNQDRPFIIASHSQGTHHAMRLLREVVDTGELSERMVAAYLVGGIVIPVTHSSLSSMANISACTDSEQLRCVVHWDTQAEGAPADLLGLPRPADSLCTNPLSWQVNEEMVTAEQNAGAVFPEGTYNAAMGKGEDTSTSQAFEALPASLDQHTWAQCRDGWLYVQDQTGSEFDEAGTLVTSGNYHMLDYALFYMNIRNNAKLRANRYMEQRRK